VLTALQQELGVVPRQQGRSLKTAFAWPGFMVAGGNHIPSLVPVENALFYFDYLKQHWERK
jgi:hypothetical protein